MEKYYLININEVNGERHYNTHMVQAFPAELTIEQVESLVEEEHTSQWIGGKSTPEDDGYSFDGGSYFVQTEEVREITKEDFDVLAKYL